MRRLSSAFTMALLLVVLSIGVEVQSEEFLPYIPDSSQVGLIYWEHSGISCMNITVEFPSTAFSVSSWGTPITTANNTSVDAEFWNYTGLSFPVVTTVSHTYNLGALPCGEYNFLFEVWGSPVKNATFVASREIIVPDDYSSIQEAINAASDGDTIFVRNGTYYENVVVNRSATLVGESKDATIMGDNATDSVLLIEADNASVKGFSIVAHTSPVLMGILLKSCTNCLVENNEISFNAGLGTGMAIKGGSNHSLIGNHIESCTRYGVTIQNSTHNLILGNSMNPHGASIELMLAHFNQLRWNRFEFHFGSGPCVSLMTSHNNTIEANILYEEVFGQPQMDLYQSQGNLVYHNNFDGFNCGVNFWDENCTGNIWDNGCEGNYWGNYNGTDLNGDGVGDTELPWLGVDNYPLMTPYWDPADFNHDLKVDIFDAVIIGDAYGSTPADLNWNPRCDLTEPYDIVDIFDVVLFCDSYGKGWS